MGGIKRQPLFSLVARLSFGMTAQFLRNPIFIIGCARSGTSLLARLVSTHPDVAHWSEANNVWDPADPGRAIVDGEGWWRDNERRQKDIRAIFGAYQAATRRRHFMNKTPGSTFRIPYILRMFPDAKFVHIVRDGRAVAYSYALKIHEKKRSAWEKDASGSKPVTFDVQLLRCAGVWKRSVEEVRRQDGELNLRERGLLMDVTYEDLCSSVNHVLDELCQYVGLDKDRFGSFTQLESISSRNDKWHSELSDEMTDKLTQAMQPTLNIRGYS